MITLWDSELGSLRTRFYCPVQDQRFRYVLLKNLLNTNKRIAYRLSVDGFTTDLLNISNATLTTNIILTLTANKSFSTIVLSGFYNENLEN